MSTHHIICSAFIKTTIRDNNKKIDGQRVEKQHFDIPP